MSDVMLLGILNMPLDYPLDELTHIQLVSACREAAVRIEADKKYRMFFESCSCFFAEGVEFMTKTEIYEAIKKEVKKLESNR